MKYSKLTGIIAYSGGQMTLREGAAIEDDHPLVIERPELFRDGDETSQVPMPSVVQSTMQDGPGGSRVQNPRPGRVAKAPGQ